MSVGKEFEHQFRQSAIKQGIWIFRINDTFVKAREYDPQAFVPQQACDYIMHQGEYLYMIELKTTDKKYITIERDGSKGMIKKHQYSQLFQKKGNKEFGGLVLQFQRETEDQATYFLSIDGFMKFLEESDKKSINRLDVVQYGGVVVEQAKVKNHWWYNIQQMLSEITIQ